MKRLLLIAALGFVSVAFSQKGNTSSAGIALKNYEMAFATGDFETAGKELKDAMGFIDQSYVNDETKNDPKTLMYYGKIYLSLPMYIGMSGDTTTFAGVDMAAKGKEGFEALKKSKELDTKGGYHEDVNGFAQQYYLLMRQQGVALYEKEEWGYASMTLLGAGEFGELMGVTDSSIYFYGGLAAYQADSIDLAEEAFKKCVEIQYQTAKSAHYYSEILQKKGKTEEAEKMLTDLVGKYPGNKDILIEMINLYIGTDRKEQAITALNDVIALDPKNVQLVYTAGTIYENMEDFENAEKYYLKALEISAADANTLSALGGLYFNKGADLNNQANKLEFGDPNYDKLVADSKDYFNKAIPYLEKAVEASPDECSYKMALRDAYGKAGDVEKFKEMKQKAADCQGN